MATLIALTIMTGFVTLACKVIPLLLEDTDDYDWDNQSIPHTYTGQNSSAPFIAVGVDMSENSRAQLKELD